MTFGKVDMRIRYTAAERYFFFVFLSLLSVCFSVHAQEEGEEEEETVWTGTAHTQYQNKDNNRGVDMSNDLATLLYSARLDHASGFSLEAGASNLLGSGGGFEKWYATLGYSHSVNSWLLLSGELSHFRYADDSLNAIANLSNSITLGATFQTSVVNVGVSYNTYFGGGTANYYGLNFDRTFQATNLTINPSVNLSFISQTIDQKRLVSYKKAMQALTHGGGRGMGGGGGGSTTTTTPSSVSVAGLSGITVSVALSYDLGGGFSVEAQPTYVNSPKGELASNTSQFLWAIGLSYSKDF